MNKTEIMRDSIRIITEYYESNLEPYFGAITDDVLWIGPREGQILHGKDRIIRAWGSQKTDLRFTMGSIECNCLAIGSSVLEVLLEYQVFTHFPGDETDEHHQRLHLSWGLQRADGKQVPKIFMIHLSNIAGQETSASSQEVRIYASSLQDSRRDSVHSLSKPEAYHPRIVYGKGRQGAVYRFSSDRVLYIESANRSRHTVIHTLDGDYDSTERLSAFAERFGDTMLRAHASFLINPLFVQSLERFHLTMTDGTEIPVPEKKYSLFRKQLTEWECETV